MPQLVLPCSCYWIEKYCTASWREKCCWPPIPFPLFTSSRHGNHICSSKRFEAARFRSFTGTLDSGRPQPIPGFPLLSTWRYFALGRVELVRILLYCSFVGAVKQPPVSGRNAKGAKIHFRSQSRSRGIDLVWIQVLHNPRKDPTSKVRLIDLIPE